MKTRIVVLFALVLLSSFNHPLSTAHAQGTAFTYQGQLTDNGSPASGIYDLRFEIYDLAIAGAQQGGTLAADDLAISNGLFTVTLDFGAVFPGADRWLEISVRPGASSGSYSNLGPRQQLTSTPYAVRAANFSGTVAASQIAGTISSNNIGAGSITTVMLASGAVGSNQLAAGTVTPEKVATATVSDWFLAQKIVNPTPSATDNFGVSVAAAGSNEALVGAYLDDTGATDAGAAYLFSCANGALLTTFTNPTPANGDYFGWSVSAAGADRVLIGAYRDDTGATDAGAAYLFSTNGTLLTTFTNPVPGLDARFGYSVAGAGNNRALIGAYLDDTGATDAGVAYLFDTDGTLITVITNPTPEAGENFGFSVAAAGSDRVLIGAYADNVAGPVTGAAYVFNTNGVLLTTFTNPVPETEFFGYSVAAVGNDRVLIGAVVNSTGAFGAGAAHLFSTNGSLLITFTNPAPAASDEFGNAVAAVGGDRVLIGASFDDAGAGDSGAAYLFSTDGVLLATLTNSAPVSGDLFGASVAAVGTNQLLIGTIGSDAGASAAGAVNLFRIEIYASGLIADGVRDGSITHADFDPTVGSWSRSGNNVFRLEGNVGIGTASPGFNLHVNGSAGKPGGGSWSVASDGRLKKNIRPLAGALDKLMALHGVNFEYIAPAQVNELSGERMGLIAQEVEMVFPDWVETGPDGYKRVTVRGLEALLVEAVRELRTEQDDAVEKIKSENAELKERLEKLERLMSEKNGGNK